MADDNRLGEPGERNPNEAMDEFGSTQGTEPGTGDPGEGAPAGPTPTVPGPPPAAPAPPAGA